MTHPSCASGLISVLTGQVWSLAVGIVAVSGFFLLLYKTRPGRAFRAIAEDPNGARLVGIPLLRTGLYSYALSGVLGGIIAVLLAMLLGSASPGLGEQVAHKVLAVSIIAGLGNLAGGLVVGLAPGSPGGHRPGLHLRLLVERHRVRHHAGRDPGEAEGSLRHQAVGGTKVPLPLYYFLSITAVNILMSWALYLPYRVAHLHFITVANMAISGYTAAWLVMSAARPVRLGARWSVSPWAAIIGCMVSLFIGDAPTFAVVIVGFTFIFITRTVIENLKAVGGTMGMFGLPNIGGSPGAHRLTIILAILYGLVLLVGFLIHRFDHSRLGRAASAVFVDKDLAASLGVDIKRAGHAPADSQLHDCGRGRRCCTASSTRASTSIFSRFALVGIAMTIIFVGGYATMWGSLVLAPILFGIPLLFPSEIQTWRIVIYGALLILVLVLKPEGFVTRRFVYSIETFLSGDRKKRNTL